MNTEVNQLTEQIIGAAIDVYKNLGRRIGLLFNFRTTLLTKHGLRRLAL
jgi:hypothetical protein